MWVRHLFPDFGSLLWAYRCARLFLGSSLCLGGVNCRLPGCCALTRFRDSDACFPERGNNLVMRGALPNVKNLGKRLKVERVAPLPPHSTINNHKPVINYFDDHALLSSVPSSYLYANPANINHSTTTSHPR